MSNPAFHRLLSFFATRSPHPNTSTITFLDSLRGDLSLGLNFPIAVFLALTRHLVFGNAGPLRFNIYVPTVRTSRKLLGGPGAFDIDENKRPQRGVVAQVDALGFWALAAGKDGRVGGGEVRAFQRGDVEGVVERRRSRRDVLPFWRGGPLIPAGHSWFVKRLFDVDVYTQDEKRV
ncbi:hypothetical protein H2203_006546 [Taxawa tesnikishii (nom. ined.)]|nr:hypothetical protein H2203_006546 [Dothideales sp. JES 119]